MMGDALYRPILKKAYQITKKFKHLWFFGLFVALLGSSGEFEIFGRALSQKTDRGIISSIIEGISSGFSNGTKGGLMTNIWTAAVNSPKSIIFIILIIILAIAITFFFIWLAIISQIGIIKNTSLAAKNEKSTINEGIDFAVKKFWPILGINAVFKIILFILLLLLSKEIYLFASAGLAGLGFYYISFIAFMTSIFVISFVVRYQIFYVLLKKQKITEALESGWQLFTKNWLTSLEIGLILFIIYIIAAIITSLVIAISLALPFVMLAYYPWSLWLITTVSIISLLLMLIVSFTITATVMTFQWASWTLLFEQLDSGSGTSKIIRGFDKLTEKFKNIKT